MTDTEKLAVLRLVQAIEEYRRPQRFKLGQMAEAEAANERQKGELDAAVLAAKQIISAD